MVSYAENGTGLNITRKIIETHIILGGEKIVVKSIFSFKLAVHVFCATKIGRKTRKIQNILQDRLQAELYNRMPSSIVRSSGHSMCFQLANLIMLPALDAFPSFSLIS